MENNKETRLYIYKLTQEVNLDYDTYDSIIVCAETPTEARDITIQEHNNKRQVPTWAAFDDIECEFIGIAGKDIKKGIILESFNAS